MLKVLGLLTFIIFLQTAMANDFLRSGKQLLVCEKDEILFRINWEDWDVENKSFGVRSKNKLVKFVLSIDRESRENTYKIDSEYVLYENGEVITATNGMMTINEYIGDVGLRDSNFQLYFVDKEKVDSEIKKVCKR
jgi:hypothetical protein